ncbi:septum formation family protein [Pseudonocardia endophytica]|uniref:septum formation family protein n=1 Tax=Pseudonocardia endophytica TaxID=401976 RepID=UPI0014046E73|nr:septum formation family protein [Pseudonocardia endophytica]
MDTGSGGAYDGYDGRYSRARIPSQDGSPDPTTTHLPSGRSGPDRRTPVRPGRRGGATRTVAAASGTGSKLLPTSPTARRIGVGVLVGAFLMLVVATVDSFAGTGMPVLGSNVTGGGKAEAAAPPAPPPPDTAGTCLNWTRDDAADTATVDCARPHLFEQAGSVKLADQPAFPNDAAWQKLVSDRCTPAVTNYLKGKFDPDGKFRVGALKPSQQRWDGGDKAMRCGLQTASRSGEMLPITGTVASQDQSAIVAPGTCLGINGRTVGDPTDCAQPHAVEAVGVIDLGQQFKDPTKPPSVDDQDGFLQPACQKAANDFAGNPQVIGQKKLTVYWDNLSEASWNAGSRKVNCNLATLLPDGSGFAAITGSIKGNLTVADQPAAPAAPGTPAAPSGPPTGAPGQGAAPGSPTSNPASSSAAPLPNIPPGLPGLAP